MTIERGLKRLRFAPPTIHEWGTNTQICVQDSIIRAIFVDGLHNDKSSQRQQYSKETASKSQSLFV